MFSQKKGRADINLEEPTFYVKYAGKTETFQASGKGCTHNAVQRIWDNSVEERHMRRMSLYINESGMTLVDLDSQKREPRKVDIKDISYCCAEKGAHERVFAWIAKDTAERKLLCHAVVCQSADKAKMMAIILSHSFQVAYRDWKMRQEKLARKKSGSQQLAGSTDSSVNGSSIHGSRTSIAGENQCEGKAGEGAARPGPSEGQSGRDGLTARNSAAGGYSVDYTDNTFTYSEQAGQSQASQALASQSQASQTQAGQSQASQTETGQSEASENVSRRNDVHRTNSNSSHSSSANSSVLNGQDSDSEDSTAFTNAMARMNVVEENEISFSDSAITI